MTVQWQPPNLLPHRPVVSVTARQADVLSGICLGMQNKQIGRRLGISAETVRTHVVHLYRELHTGDRAYAAALTASGQVTVLVRGFYLPAEWEAA